MGDGTNFEGIEHASLNTNATRRDSLEGLLRVAFSCCSWEPRRFAPICWLSLRCICLKTLGPQSSTLLHIEDEAAPSSLALFGEPVARSESEVTLLLDAGHAQKLLDT